MKLLTHVLGIYADLSGLRINKDKSSFVPIAIPPRLVHRIQAILSSPPASLPIRYLGLPLTVKKPRKVDFQPMLQAIQSRLQGWTSKFLSYGGRITLVKAVLSAMPLHYMQAFKLPVGVTKHIDNMRRSFLWKGNDTCKGINCLVNWERVCALKLNGGLGIINLTCQNDALLAKWIWAIESGKQGLWSKTMQNLHGVTAARQLAQGGLEDSFFIKDLASLRPLCNASIELDEGVTKWKWTKNGLFSCASAYRIMHNSGLIARNHERLWKIKVPMNVRIFIWLMLDNKILTQQVLIYRGCAVQTGCHLCHRTEAETRDHLMWYCSFSSGFWRGLMAQHNIRYGQGDNIRDTWTNTGRALTHDNRARWDVIWAAGAWALWRERNRRFFSNKRRVVGQLINDTSLEIERWLDNG